MTSAGARARGAVEPAAAIDPKLVRASLLGCAIGDSLGAEIEFMDLAAIRAAFPDGVRDLIPHQGLRGAITDDTQMTLFTAEGLIRAHVRARLRGIASAAGVVHHALLRWLATQGEVPAPEVDREHGIIVDRRLHARRAPGMTCLGALRAARRFGDAARNNSKGCGTIMRVAPVAFAAAREDVRSLAMETSALTHGHPTGQFAAAAWAELIAGAAAGDDVETCADRIGGVYAALDGGAETAAAIRSALSAPRNGRPETVEALGGGWVAEEALAIGLYAVLAHADPENALGCAVTHSGDSDSTGAVAGALLGVLHPDAILAHRWAADVECADLISALAEDLAAAQGWTEDDAQARWDRYPGW